MARSNREIVEEKLSTASVLNPGERDLLLVRANLMLVDVLADVLERILQELERTGPKTTPFLFERVTDEEEREAYERAMDRDMPK